MTECLLHDEHLLLGAQMGEGADGRSQALRYAGAAAAETPRVCLADLSAAGSRLFFGASAPSFAQAAFSGKILGVGETAVEAVLSGDGAVVSLALLARTGDAEYACWDLAGRGDVLTAWLGFLATAQQQGVLAFPELFLEDCAESLVPLLLWGAEADSVLLDYVGGRALPARGQVAQLSLDAISCLVAHVPLGEHPCYLVLVPPRYARVLWRSFLSFPVVAPQGREDLLGAVAQALPKAAQILGSTERHSLSERELTSLGLTRTERSYVGARAL